MAVTRAAARKVRGEGHWIAVIDDKPVTNIKHLEPGDAAREAKYALAARYELGQGEERLVADIAKELGIPRYMVEEIPDMDERSDYHLHVGDGLNGAVFERPRKSWTLFREPAT
uniref:Uncharacterized protein n=1 Tax=Dinoroseobacter phage vB_DshS_R26L TaxID=3161158 RepID=A0AAU7VHU9_9CAUD